MSQVQVEKRDAGEASGESTRSGAVYRPNVDILERKEELLVLADMPGLRSEDIQVRFEQGVLSIHARTPPRSGDGRKFLLREYGVGDFFRTFRVSEEIDAQKIRAEYENGVLTLHLPKSEAAKPRRIEVRAG